jgi:hypothetical protein
VKIKKRAPTAVLLLAGSVIGAYAYFQFKPSPPQNLRVETEDFALKITGPNVFYSGIVGESWSAQLVASGGKPPYKWSILEGYSLPEPLKLNADTGLISGNPWGTAGPIWFGYKVTDSAGNSDTGGIDPCWPFYFFNPLKITTDFSKVHLISNHFNGYQLTAAGYTGIYQWSVYEGSLPPGMTLSESGIFQGFPPTGTFNFKLAVKSPPPAYPAPGCNSLFSRVASKARKLAGLSPRKRVSTLPQSIEIHTK